MRVNDQKYDSNYQPQQQSRRGGACPAQHASTTKNMTLITSPSNPRISRLHDLHTTRGRKKSGLFFMEGPHLLEALLDAEIVPREVYYEPGLLQRTPQGRSLLARLIHASGLPEDHLIEVSERVIETLGEVQTSQ